VLRLGHYKVLQTLRNSAYTPFEMAIHWGQAALSLSVFKASRKRKTMNIALTKIYAVASAMSCKPQLGPLALACALVGGLGVISAAHAGPDDRDGGAREGRRHEAAQAAAHGANAERARDERGQQGPREPRFVMTQRAAPEPRAADVGRADAGRADARAFDARGDESRRQFQNQQDQNLRNADAQRRSGRLTPDERRDLRRQINEAGIDLYPNTPRR
jgi:hypothetical protein